MLTAFVAGFADVMLSCLRAAESDLVCDPHVSDEHDRAKVGIDARVRIEGAAKERRRRSARAAGVESIFEVVRVGSRVCSESVRGKMGRIQSSV